MRENRTYGSEGGGAQLNACSLPLSYVGQVRIRAASEQRFDRHARASRPRVVNNRL